MPSQVLTTVENSFTKGLVTEFTGLNFPENAATDCDNVEFTLVGDVNRRLGINYETNYAVSTVNRTSKAISTYKWNNAGGDGTTQVVVTQIGGTLRFYKSNLATTTSPLSAQILGSTVDISTYVAAGGTFDATLECDYSTGNGYLFVYHPSCEPIYCTLSGSTVTAAPITVQIRDFGGIVETGVSVSDRPLTLTNEHQYNLVNQGWTAGAPWQGISSTSVTVVVGSKVFTVASGLTVTLGDGVVISSPVNLGPGGPYAGQTLMSGTVTAYSGTSLTINVTSISNTPGGGSWNNWVINPVTIGYITTWHTGIGNYPSNADVWWRFKNSSDVFAPVTTISNVTLNSGRAPTGRYILPAFQQDRGLAAGISLTSVTTTVRPRTGTWFQGRVWYTGVDGQQAATGDAATYGWSENIYFSQIITNTDDFGHCYQTNDPTSEDLFDLLPTDGGVIQIQGCGAIYKLFPIQNSLLIFAANGIWYLTGSTGIGFAANDYTIYKLSEVRSVSGTSVVNVNGLPFFWNEEGIYSVAPGKDQTNNPDNRRNALEVTPITVGTILSFYNEIPTSSKRYARGAYDPIDYTIKWIYKSTEAADTTGRYEFDKILNFNTYNNAFYPYTVSTDPSAGCTINSIVYVSNPGGSTAPTPTFKYFSSNINGGSYNLTFAEEYDTSYKDWTVTTHPLDYTSYFITGYKLHGQGQRRFQIPYIYIFSRADEPTSYKIQGIWDYASVTASHRWSTVQTVNNWSPNFGMIFRRHKIRGQGIVLQIKVTSVAGQPFDLMGWSAFETQNTSI